jgi:4'-phosphopantetheinyl transferase
VPAQFRASILNEGDVCVWVVTLPNADARWAETWDVISQDEREHANRLARGEDRALWIHTRALLRRLLAGQLSVDPQRIVFGEGPLGKPKVVSEPASNGRLEFSVSHSGAVAAITVARDRRVGIDVERIQPDLSWEPLAKRFFSAADIASIEGRPPAERLHTFFDCWVRKESYLKGLGVGLRRALDGFSVPMGSAVGAVVDPEAQPLPSGEGRWRIHPMDVPDGYAAALAVEGGGDIKNDHDPILIKLI